MQGERGSGLTTFAAVVARTVTDSRVLWIDGNHDVRHVMGRWAAAGITDRYLVDGSIRYVAPPLAGDPAQVDLTGVGLLVVEGWSRLRAGDGDRLLDAAAESAATVLVTENCAAHRVDGMYGPGSWPVYDRADVAFHVHLVTLGGRHARVRLCRDRFGGIRTLRGDYPAAAEIWVGDHGVQIEPGRDSIYEPGTKLEKHLVSVLRTSPGLDTKTLFRLLGDAPRASKERLLKRLADDGTLRAEIDVDADGNPVQVWYLPDTTAGAA